MNFKKFQFHYAILDALKIESKYLKKEKSLIQ